MMKIQYNEFNENKLVGNLLATTKITVSQWISLSIIDNRFQLPLKTRSNKCLANNFGPLLASAK